MTVYKRSKWELVKRLFLALFGALAGMVAVSFFTADMRVLYTVGAVLFVLLVCFMIFLEHFYFEIGEGGEFRYFKRKKLQSVFDLKECAIGYTIHKERGIPGAGVITLEIVPKAAGSRAGHIDCSGLGKTRFKDMYANMREFTGEEPEEKAATTEGPDGADVSGS